MPQRDLDPEGAHLAAFTAWRTFVDRESSNSAGDGRLTVGIAADAAATLAFDPDAEAVDKARGSLPSEPAERVTYLVAAGDAIELAPHSFDLVVFSWSL